MSNYIPVEVYPLLSKTELSYLNGIFDRFNGYPRLQDLWQLMDDAWIFHNCDSQLVDGRIIDFYRHPVWLLNGLFVDQHEESVYHRKEFTRWVVDQSPVRVADYGGGFGSLARLIGKALPNTEIEVVEPFPHPAAKALAKNTPNVKYVNSLSGKYDILIATDVFEHVPDPIRLAATTALYLRSEGDGGKYLMANAFVPIIYCHLPQLMHLNYSWEYVMNAMGLSPGEKISYGRIFNRKNDINIGPALRVAKFSNLIYPLISIIPRGRDRIGRLIMRLFF